MSACWPLQGMSAAQKAVLISLADQASDDGVCWPGIGTIARRTCLSERAVQEALSWLQKVGLVYREYRTNSSTSYTITPGRFDPSKAPAARSRLKAGGAYGAPPADSAPPAHGAPGGEPGAPLPPQEAHPRGAPSAPKSSLNRNRNHQRTAICAGGGREDLPDPHELPKPAAGGSHELAGTVCQLLKRMGMGLVNPGNAKLNALLNAGVTVGQIEEAARKALDKGKTFTYALAIVEREERDARNLGQALAQQRVAQQAGAETFAQRAARQRVEEVSPAVARKVPGVLSAFERAQAFMNGADVIDVTPSQPRIGG